MPPSSLHTPRNTDQILISLATRQHGVVARTQLVGAGVSPDCLDHRLRSGRIRLLHRGVYLVGPLVVPNAGPMAAVLACGRAAAVSHRSAVFLWRWLPARSNSTAIEVVVTRGRARRRPGIHVRHIHTVLPSEITSLEGIPVTTPERTLFDFASIAGQRELEPALAEAIATRTARRARLLELLGRHAGRPGARRLLELLQGGNTPARTRSEAEERLLALLR